MLKYLDINAKTKFDEAKKCIRGYFYQSSSEFKVLINYVDLIHRRIIVATKCFMICKFIGHWKMQCEVSVALTKYLPLYCQSTWGNTNPCQRRDNMHNFMGTFWFAILITLKTIFRYVHYSKKYKGTKQLELKLSFSL